MARLLNSRGKPEALRVKTMHAAAMLRAAQSCLGSCFRLKRRETVLA